MKVNIFSQNRLLFIYGLSSGSYSVLTSLSSQSSLLHEFTTLDELRQITGNEWYRCLKVGCVRNPYDLAVSLHFWFQQTIEPKSMTLVTSIRDPRWKALFTESLLSMTLIDFDDFIRFENLEEDTQRIQKIFGFNAIELPNLIDLTRPSDTKENYHSLYDSRTKAVITRMSKSVLSEYEYSF